MALKFFKFLDKSEEKEKSQSWLEEGVAKMIKYSKLFAEQALVDYLKANKPS